MRRVASCSSAARLRAVSVAATQPSAASVAGPASGRHALQPVLVDPGRGERLGQAPRLGHAERLEPLEQRILGVGGVERVERGAPGGALDRLACRATSFAASSRSMPDSTKRRSVAPTTSTASTIWSAARPAAAAGLLSSCASPAAIVPSEVSRSRFCSIAVMRLMTGATCCITRRCTAGWANASRRNSSGSMTPSAARGLGLHAHAQRALRSAR